MNIEKDYFRILDIPFSSGPKTIERAYYKELSLYQEDSIAGYSLFSEEQLSKKRKDIEEAFKVLISEEKRKEYLKAKSISVEVDLVNDENTDEATSYVHKLEAKNKYHLEFIPCSEMENKIEIEEDFFGIFLKQVREYKNVSIERMCRLTNILKTYIIAIEEDDFENLPATVYAFYYSILYNIKNRS